METEKLLAELISIPGIAGNEQDVACFIKENVKPFVDDIKIDGIGNVIALQKGQKPQQSIMLAANMDQVGFMVTFISEEGYIKISQVGQGCIESKSFEISSYIADRVMIIIEQGQGVPGVIGFPRIFHHSAGADLNKNWQCQDLFIDIGVKSKAEVEAKGISIGSPVVSQPLFWPLAGKQICAPALHSRVGCLWLMQALQQTYQQRHDDDLYWVFTVQQTIGSKGMKCLSNSLNPQWGIVIAPSKVNEQVQLGEGPVVKYAEGWGGLRRGLIGDRRLIKNFQESDKKVQLEVSEGLVGQGKEFVSAGFGIPGITLGYPVANLFASTEIVDLTDLERGVDLLVRVILTGFNLP